MRIVRDRNDPKRAGLLKCSEQYLGRRQGVAQGAMDESKLSAPARAAEERAAQMIGEERVVRSAQLFCGDKEVVIEHDGERYRLRRTSKGKLILTK